MVGDKVFTPEGIAGGFIILALQFAGTVDEQVGIADAGIDECAVARVREVAGADIVDIAEIVVGVEDIRVGFARSTFGDGFHKRSEGSVIIEAFARVGLAGGSHQEGLEDYQ